VTSSQSSSGEHEYALAIFGGVLALFAAVIVVGALLHRAPDNVLVLATRKDCLRAFDNGTCERIVDAALKIHVKSAPRFFERETCELSFGEGRCRAIAQVPSTVYVPDLAVILAARGSNAGGLLPAYLGRSGEKASDDGSRRVYYRGTAIGRLSDVKFGGAQISRVADLKGAPLTVGEVERLLKR
jgi:uncharacterized protein YgiB involved in biofilm formation